MKQPDCAKGIAPSATRLSRVAGSVAFRAHLTAWLAFRDEFPTDQALVQSGLA